MLVHFYYEVTVSKPKPISHLDIQMQQRGF